MNRHRAKFRRSSSAFSQNRGVTVVELMVSMVLLFTLMSFVTTICFQVNFIWRDINQHRIALGEISNQLEQLTELPREDAVAALESLQPSTACARTLRAPVLTGEVVDDDFGSQIVLRINWHRKHPGKPLELVGWITKDVSSPQPEDDQ
jgi:hypothetical protein